MPLARLTALVLTLLAAMATSAQAAGAPLPGAHVSAKKYAPSATYPGLQHLHYEYGPIDIVPGQNTIDFGANRLKPTVPGYITRFHPNLVYAANHQVPRVDVIHLHRRSRRARRRRSSTRRRATATTTTPATTGS
jgi:hypothetical protein